MKFTKQEIRNLKRLCDAVKARDKVNLRPGDWFCDTSNDNLYYTKIYKVIKAQKESFNGFTKGLPVEVYQLEYQYNSDKPMKIIKKEITTLSDRDLGWMKITVFGSAQEAMKWMRHQIEVVKAHKY